MPEVAQISWVTVANTFISTLPLIIGAAGAFIVLFRKVDKVAKTTNGLLEQRVADTKDKAMLVGHADGVADEQARQTAAAMLARGRKGDAPDAFPK